jgi:hypothetical protein
VKTSVLNFILLLKTWSSGPGWRLFGFALTESVKNPRYEIGKTKQYPMTEIKMIKTKDIARIAIDRLFLSLASLIVEIVSSFAIRMSRFVDRIWLNHALWV